LNLTTDSFFSFRVTASSMLFTTFSSNRGPLQAC
jgi:hypothetical protein